MQHKMLVSRIKCFASKIRSKFIGYHYQRMEILGLRTFTTRNIFLIFDDDNYSPHKNERGCIRTNHVYGKNGGG